MLKAAIIIREELDLNNTLSKIYGAILPTASSIIANNNISVPLREVRWTYDRTLSLYYSILD